MAFTGPTESDPIEAPDSSFEIEEGHFGPHLPRPSWEMIFAVGGTLLILVGFYLPWLTMRIQTNPGTGDTTTTTTQLSGLAFASGKFLSPQSGVSGGIGLLLLTGMPVVAGLLALLMNILLYLRRANTLSCGVALGALAVGLSMLFAESTMILFIGFILEFPNGGGAESAQIGLGMPLMYLGYIALAAATFAMCVGYWRRVPATSTH